MNARLPALLLGLSLSAAGQFVPWTEGDLVVLVADPAGGGNKLRVFDPLTGNGQDIVELLGGYFGSGWMAYDSYRHGIVMSTTDPGSYLCTPNCIKLWLVDGAGQMTSLGLDGVAVKSLAPTGDGRIYFRRQQVGAGVIEYLDANGALHVLMDGAVPFTEPNLEHLVYVPSEQALIGLMSWGVPNACNGDVWHVNVLRIPLTADGSALAGPVTCDSYLGDGAAPRGIDLLPGGDVLFSTNHGGAAGGLKVLGSIDPAGPFSSVWGEPTFPGSNYNNGVVWSPLLGKAVVIDRVNEVLRLFAPGESGLGTVLPTSLKPAYTSGGWGAGTSIVDVHQSGPGCDGFLHAYGDGLAGAGGVVPLLGGDGCPAPGSLLTLHISEVVGGASGMLFVGATQASAPFKGGTFLVGSVLLQVGLAVGGPAGVPGAGNLDLPALIPDNPILSGVSLYLQAGFQDAGAVKGVSLTNGLQLAIG